VRMTDMPQLVAAFNGAGGGAAAVVGIIELAEWAGTGTTLANGAAAFAVLVGSVALSGSVVTFLKLQGLMTSRPVVMPAAPAVMAQAGPAAVVLAVLTTTTGHTGYGGPLLAVGLLLGVLLVLPVGGADVPIVISLLNACTGLAVAGSGLAMPNTLMLVAGTLV